MNQAEARRRIWERLAATARADKDLGDWMLDETGGDHADMRRIEKACDQVADSIERMLKKKAGR